MAGQNISHEGHRQRMRARVEQYGLESLAPHEALEYLLYITNARRDTNGIAHALLLPTRQLVRIFAGHITVQPDLGQHGIHSVGTFGLGQVVMQFQRQRNLLGDSHHWVQ